MLFHAVFGRPRQVLPVSLVLDRVKFRCVATIALTGIAYQASRGRDCH
jgi:hypothetical protein